MKMVILSHMDMVIMQNTAMSIHIPMALLIAIPIAMHMERIMDILMSIHMIMVP